MKQALIAVSVLIISVFIFNAFIDTLPAREVEFIISNNEIPVINVITPNEHLPKMEVDRLIEIDLTNNKIYFFENNKLQKTFSILSQGPYGKWYQTPTGYFSVGSKEATKISRLADPPVYMNYAVQLYEDFYIHEKTKYLTGELTSFTYTGGCLRLDSQEAQEFFKTVKKGDRIISYDNLQAFKIKDDFASPIDEQNFWVRQRFNNPLRGFKIGSTNRAQEYIHHAGLDLAPQQSAKDLRVYNIYDGKVVKIIKNGEEDHGFGNTVIIEHYFNDNLIYSLYGHLKEINSNIKVNQEIKRGEIIGIVGATGYGCDFWRIGDDSCNNSNPLDAHLHLELKTKPILSSPTPSQCFVNGKLVTCYGYTPDNPLNYGYLDPFTFLFEKK